MIPLAAFALAPCLAVAPESDRILARDLASVLPALAAGAPDTPVAFAPAPGVRRVLRGPELRRLALRWNASPPPEGEICFERRVAPLDAERIRAAMRRELPGASINVLDFSRAPVPEGELRFPLAGFRNSASGGYWAGFVRYAGNRRFAVWARVKARVAVTRVVAVSDLKAGQPVEASGLRLETHEDSPSDAGFATSLDEAAGKLSRRPIRAGAALLKSWLERPPDVARGDTVRVEVSSGGARLEAEARAEASGSAGQTIPLRNPVSNRRFFGRVEGKGKVSVRNDGR
jgi:flagella basal body P-ring formation protein FlgA